MTDKKIILVVEDEIPLLEAIKIKMGSSGFEVVTARNVEQAINHLKDIPKIDVIWLDHYLLGKKTGLDFISEIKKEDSLWKQIPVFVVSNTASHDKVQSYLKLGATDYYVKAEKRLDEIIGDIKKHLNI